VSSTRDNLRTDAGRRLEKLEKRSRGGIVKTGGRSTVHSGEKRRSDAFGPVGGDYGHSRKGLTERGGGAERKGRRVDRPIQKKGYKGAKSRPKEDGACGGREALGTRHVRKPDSQPREIVMRINLN